MRKLPDNTTLRALYNDGLRDSEVAARHGVSRQAVQKRWSSMGLVRRPVVQEVRDLLRSTWDLQSEKEATMPPRAQWASRCLRLVLRSRLGDTLTPADRKHAETWLGTLREHGWVVAYDQVVGWHYTGRKPEDLGWIVRWPADRPMPSARHQAVLFLDPPAT